MEYITVAKVVNKRNSEVVEILADVYPYLDSAHTNLEKFEKAAVSASKNLNKAVPIIGSASTYMRFASRAATRGKREHSDNVDLATIQCIAKDTDTARDKLIEAVTQFEGAVNAVSAAVFEIEGLMYEITPEVQPVLEQREKDAAAAKTES